MGSGGGGGGNPALLTQNAAPMQGLPIAGKDSTIGNPADYGQFQSFLPDIPKDGQAPMATGLTPDMLKFKAPNGTAVDSGAMGQIKELRDALAALKLGAGDQDKNQFGAAQQPSWEDMHPNAGYANGAA